MSRPIAPSEPFKPYVLSAAEPWDLPRVSHLFRRACLGATWVETQAAMSSQPRTVINQLFDFDPEVDELNDLLERVEGLFDIRDVRRAQEWWLYRFLNTHRPIQERMALFWHNHFATSASKVSNGDLMNGQIELFRRLGTGNFRELLLEVGRNAAMLVWLDGRYSKKGTPNENYAREVMELFTLGPGHYTEADVKELARAFTGWEVSGAAAVFNRQRFDDGPKTILGKTGPFTDEQAVDLLLEQPAAPKFIARKLLAELVHPDPEQAHVDHVAERLKHHKWSLKPVLKEILGSRLFFSDYAFRSRVKSPCELLIGMVKAVGGKAKVNWMRDETSRLGQDILFPPNVGGWEGDRAWINANTMLTRFNLGLKLARQDGGEYSSKSKWLDELSELGVDSYEKVVDHLADRLLGGRISAKEREAYIEYVHWKNDKGELKPFKLEGGFVYNKVHGLIHLMMTSPIAHIA